MAFLVGAINLKHTKGLQTAVAISTPPTVFLSPLGHMIQLHFCVPLMSAISDHVTGFDQ